jgi:hypothetical protein
MVARCGPFEPDHRDLLSRSVLHGSSTVNLRRSLTETDLVCLITLHAPVDADERERSELGRSLRKEVSRSSDAQAIHSGETLSSPGTKGVSFDLHTLVVTLAASGGVLSSLVSLLQRWLTRREAASVTLEIKGDKLLITGASPESERLLVNQWLSRHNSPETSLKDHDDE